MVQTKETHHTFSRRREPVFAAGKMKDPETFSQLSASRASREDNALGKNQVGNASLPSGTTRLYPDLLRLNIP